MVFDYARKQVFSRAIEMDKENWGYFQKRLKLICLWKMRGYSNFHFEFQQRLLIVSFPAY